MISWISGPTLYCLLQNSAQWNFYGAFWGLIGYHISSNQYETTIFGPKIMRIRALLAEIPDFHCMASIGHWWGLWPFAGTGSVREGLRFCKRLTYDTANERSWNVDNEKYIDRSLKYNSRGATPDTVQRQARLLFIFSTNFLWTDFCCSYFTRKQQLMRFA